MSAVAMSIQENQDAPAGAGPSPRRAQAAWGCIVAGAVSLAIGWFFVSGTRDIPEQLTYLAGGGLFGVFLAGVGGALLLGDFIGGQEQRLSRVEALVEDLHALALDEGPNRSGASLFGGPEAFVGDDDGTVVAIDGARRVHRRGCEFVRGKSSFRVLPAAEARAEGLLACRVCAADLPDPAPDHRA